MSRKTARVNSGFAPVPAEPLSQVTQVHNSLLTEALNGLSGLNPDLNIIPLDVFSLFNQTLNSPEEFGFTNVTEACLNPDPSVFPNLAVPESFTFNPCENPDEYLFWDGIHPTTATHAILGEFALATLQDVESVPEPRVPVALGLFVLLSWMSNRKKSNPKSDAFIGERLG